MRLYVRRRGKRVRLRLLPGAADFMGEYQAALAKLDEADKPAAGKATGTLGWLVNEFEHSHAFLKSDLRERRVRHQIVDAMLNEETKPGSGKRFRDCPIAYFSADHVRVLRDRKKATPAAANRRVKELRIMLAWALEERGTYVKRNLAADVKRLKYSTEGFHTWTEEEVAKYEAHHLVGTMARLAFSIMLFTGMRKSDAVLLGPKRVKNGWITFRPEKTKRSTGKELSLPVLDVLRDTIAATPHGIETYLVTQYGKPWSPNGFGNWFRDRCDEAGLPECTAHGLRKIGAVRAAENGATEQQMMAIFGWDSPKLAAYYAKKANQKKMAGEAMHKLVA